MDQLKSTAVQQLMEQIRKQDELIHSWTATLVTTQGGLLTAAGFLWNASSIGIHTKGLGTLLLGCLAAVVTWTCTDSIRSECLWQGKYISYLKAVPGNDWIYTDVNPEPKVGGTIARGAERVASTIYGLWTVLAMAALVKVAYWSPYFHR